MKTRRDRMVSWARRAARAALVGAFVLGLGATPGCICRSRTYGYVPGRRVVVTTPVRSTVRVAPAPVRGPSVRVGAPVARPVPVRR
jgi:hypothetical protein